MAKPKAQHRISPPKNKKPGLGGRLTIKQKRFVEDYIKNGGNGTRSVIEAGYRVASESSAQVIASQYLKKPIIALALEKAGYEVKIINDTSINFKITTKEDWIVAEALFNHLN